MAGGHDSTGIDRRGFLGLVGAGVLATTFGGAVTACGTPSAPQTGSALGGSELAGVLPTHVPVDFVKPDLAGVNGSNGAPPAAMYVSSASLKSASPACSAICWLREFDAIRSSSVPLRTSASTISVRITMKMRPVISTTPCWRTVPPRER